MSRQLSAHEWETPAPMGLASTDGVGGEGGAGGGEGGRGGGGEGGGEGGEGGGGGEALEARLPPLRLLNAMGSPIEVRSRYHPAGCYPHAAQPYPYPYPYP